MAAQHRRWTWFVSGVSVILAGISTMAHADNPAYRLRLQTNDITLRPDGTRISTLHNEIQILNAAAVTGLAQFPITYSEQLDNIEVVEAYTLKADGRKLPVEASSIVMQQASNQTLAATYTDKKQKVIIFPNVEVGDTLVFTQKSTGKQALLPGQYALFYQYPSTYSVDEERVTLSVPKSMALNTEFKDIDVQKNEVSGRIVYSWRYSHPTAEAAEPSAISQPDLIPHVYFSTLKTYAELEHEYAALALPKIAVTAKIKQQADAITADINDKREQARAIYEWVSQRVRYVAILLGSGGIVPHDAEWVLNNAYGDCKDHAVLFISLLKAKGIAADPVLINTDSVFTLSPVPSIAHFNHMIVWLPDFSIYADTTVSTAAFGTLPLQEYGKPVVHLAGTGTVQRQVPVMTAGVFSTTDKTTAKINDMGQLSVETQTTATGVAATLLRLTAKAIQASGAQTVAGNLLKKHGMPYATGNFTLSANSTLTSQYSLSSNFQTTGTPGGNIFSLVDALQVSNPTGDLLMGRLDNKTLKETAPTTCYNGHQTEDISLELPPGRQIRKLPTDTNVQTDHLQFTSHWSMDGQTVSVHREFTSEIDEPLCTGEVRQQAAAALEKIRQDRAAAVVVMKQ